MDGQGIFGIIALVVGVVALTAGLLLLVTWPYWLDVVAIVGGSFLILIGVVLLRRSGSNKPRGA
jgi:small neutral amino acid transporter SnatA (MarC family)